MQLQRVTVPACARGHALSSAYRASWLLRADGRPKVACCAAAEPAVCDWDQVFAHNGKVLPAPYASPSLEVRDVPGDCCRSSCVEWHTAQPCSLGIVDSCAGKGRGVFAARPVEPGELLFVVQPLVYLQSDPGTEIPNVEQLLAK